MKKILWTLIPVLMVLGIIILAKPAAKAAEEAGERKQFSVTEQSVPAAGFLVSEAKASDGEDADKGAGFYVKKFLIAAVIGLIVALIAIGVMQSGMKNIRKSSNAAGYVDKSSFQLRVSEDRFLREETKRTKTSN